LFVGNLFSAFFADSFLFLEMLLGDDFADDEL
jgi:ABC-type siderophore export system fused ATPase/permease subunit